MSGFDAELYLRIAGEETLLGARSSHGRPWSSPLDEPAGALIAIGAISPGKAREVIDDYGFADALRSEQGRHDRGFISSRGGRKRQTVKPLKPRGIVPCERTIETDEGSLHVRYVSLSENSTTLAIIWRPSVPSGSRRSNRGRNMMMWGAGGPRGRPQKQLTDDRGTTVQSGFSGGGSDSEWAGHLSAHSPLSPDTAWIEVDGARIALDREAVACDVTIETLTDQPPALGYLWFRLATPQHFHEAVDIDAAIDALVAAGALEPDDPTLADVRAVHAALPGHHRSMRPTGSGVRRLPEPWRSMLSRQGRSDGPQGTVAASAVTPEFDGRTVAVGCIESHQEGFSAEVEIAPGNLGDETFGRRHGFQQLAWWASDDRENHYLGQINGWHGGEDSSGGEISFSPALHPKAKRLDLMPTTQTTRAVISLPLAWVFPESTDSEPRP